MLSCCLICFSRLATTSGPCWLSGPMRPTCVAQPPGSLSRSMMKTDSPMPASESAARMPATPAPTTRTRGWVSMRSGGQRGGQRGLGHAGAHDVDALERGARLVAGMHPGALLAQIDVHVLVGVQPGALRHGAEREHVKLRGARGDDEAIQLLFLDLVDHLLLRSIRAGEQMRPRDLDFRFASRASSATSFTFTWSEMFPPQWQT